MFDIHPPFLTLMFYGESLDDLELMPTTKKEGQGKYQYGCAPAASLAYIITEDGVKLYMLRTSGWVDVTDSGILSTVLWRAQGEQS